MHVSTLLSSNCENNSVYSFCKGGNWHFFPDFQANASTFKGTANTVIFTPFDKLDLVNFPMP